MAIGFTLDLQDFQLTDFAKKASFVSSGSFRLHGGDTNTKRVDPLPFT